MGTYHKSHAIFIAKIVFGVFFGALVLPNGVKAQDDVLEIAGAPLRACTVAYKDFETRGWDVRNFIVRVKKMGTGHQVTFVPRQQPGKATVRGGRTAFGQEISYVVSDEGKIVKVHYAR